MTGSRVLWMSALQAARAFMRELAIPGARRRMAAAIAGARGIARVAKHAPDRLLHARRQRRALQLLQSRALPRSILFVCSGNVCRSPYAEASFRRRLAHGLSPLTVDMRVESAGFFGPGRPPPPEALEAARRLGVDLSQHKSQLLTRELVQRTDLVLVSEAPQASELRRRFGASKEQIVVLGDLDPGTIDTRTICDPWEQRIDVFLASYQRIDRCLDVLAVTLARRVSSRPAASPRHLRPRRRSA